MFMRMETHFVHVYIVHRLMHSRAVKQVLIDAGEIIIVELHNGARVSVHLIERYIDLDHIHTVFESNGQAGIYTLFLLWEEMLLPPAHSFYKPDGWMHALQAIYGGKTYGYKPTGNSGFVLPVYFEHQALSELYYIRFGEAVDFDRLGVRLWTTDVPVPGNWHIADFEDPPPAYTLPRAKPAPSVRPAAPSPPPISPERLKLSVYFQVLGIPLHADRDTVQQAYRRLAREAHPDVNHNSLHATKQMQRINEAYRKIIRHIETE